MFRAIPVGNKLCAARVKKRYEDQRMQRLKDMKPQTDTSKPKVMGMAHLKTNFKRNEELATRHDLIERDNRILLEHMNGMMQKQEYAIQKSNSMPHLRGSQPGGPAQARENERIRQNNHLRASRLQHLQPELRPSEYEDDYKRATDYVWRICEYPPPLVKYGPPPKVRIAKRDLLGHKLQPLPKEEHVPDQEDEDDEEDEDEEDEDEEEEDEDGSQASGAVNQDGLRYVSRTQRTLRDDEGPYNVDLATDGQRLLISAYSEETEHTLEMLVKEDNHKRLLDEVDGDYAVIAERLRIDGDHLVIEDM